MSLEYFLFLDKMLTKKFCPRCGSEDIELVAGGIGGIFMCTNCGFSGSVFPEKEIVGREMKSEGKRKIYKIKSRK